MQNVIDIKYEPTKMLRNVNNYVGNYNKNFQTTHDNKKQLWPTKGLCKVKQIPKIQKKLEVGGWVQVPFG